MGNRRLTVDTIVRRLTAVSDRELLEATRERDADAFAELYDRYHKLVFRTAQRMLTEFDASEDVVQSVFISIWKSPPPMHTGSLACWLACVTKNRVRDALRARNARREAVWPDNLILPDTTTDEVSRRLELRRVRNAVAALPESQRALIELGFFGERTHAELAAMTSLPLGTVKTRIRSGLQKLRFTLRTPGIAV